MPQGKRKIIIRELGTNSPVHEIETAHQGRSLERVLDGLYRKVDFDRFWVDSSQVDHLLPGARTDA